MCAWVPWFKLRGWRKNWPAQGQVKTVKEDHAKLRHFVPQKEKKEELRQNGGKHLCTIQ